MRKWFGCILILLASTFLDASSTHAAPVTPGRLSAKTTVIQTAVLEQHSHRQHCDQPEGTEVITAAYTQHNALGTAVPVIAHGFKTSIYATVANCLATGRDNARIQPFYKLILFPFHGFW